MFNLLPSFDQCGPGFEDDGTNPTYATNLPVEGSLPAGALQPVPTMP